MAYASPGSGFLSPTGRRGFLSPSGPTEAELARESEKRRLLAAMQELAMRQAQESSLHQNDLNARQRLLDTQQAGQAALATQNNQAAMQRLLAQLGGQRAMASDQLGAQERMEAGRQHSTRQLADAEHMFRSEEAAAEHARALERAATDFEYRDKLQQALFDMREQQDARLATMDAQSKERERMRARSSALDSTLQEFGQMSRRLSPEGQKRWHEFQKRLTALTDAERKGIINEDVLLRERNRLADEFYASGLQGEIAPYGQLPGDFQDMGLNRWLLTDKGMEDVGLRPDLSPAEIQKYTYKLPTGETILPKGMFDILQPQMPSMPPSGVGAQKVPGVDYARIWETVYKAMSHEDPLTGVSMPPDPKAVEAQVMRIMSGFQGGTGGDAVGPSPEDPQAAANGWRMREQANAARQAFQQANPGQPAPPNQMYPSAPPRQLGGTPMPETVRPSAPAVEPQQQMAVALQRLEPFGWGEQELQRAINIVTDLRRQYPTDEALAAAPDGVKRTLAQVKLILDVAAGKRTE